MRRAGMLLLVLAACGPGAASVTGPEATTDDTEALRGAFHEAKHLPWPVVKNQGGPVLVEPVIVTIVPQNHVYASQLMSFGNALANSNWWWSLAGEYGLGNMVYTYEYLGPAMTGPTDENGIFQYIQTAIDQGNVTALTGNTVYLFYVPSDAPMAGYPCDSHNGFHDTFPAPGGTGNGDTVALVMACSNGWQNANALDWLTDTASHEVAEAVTDPFGLANPAWLLPFATGNPWDSSPWQQSWGELGDLCNDEVELEGGFLYQRTWSVKAAAKGGDPCIPATKNGFYNVSNVGSPDWVQVQPGTTVDVPLTGWSTGAPSAPWWQVETWVSTSSAGMNGTNVSVSSPRAGWFGNCAHQPIAANGGSDGVVTLHITPPSTAQSGDWTVIEIDSLRQGDTQNCVATRGTDESHQWFLGAYVP